MITQPPLPMPRRQALEDDLAKLIAERSLLREREFNSLRKEESRARRTSYTFKINSLNAEIEVIRDQIKLLK